MHRSVQLLQAEEFDVPEVLEILNGNGDVMGDIDKYIDIDHSGYWQNPISSIIDDHTSQQELLELDHPVTQEINDPMLSSYWDECSRYTSKHNGDVQFDKVIVEQIERIDEFSEAINHLEDHSYYQNEPVVDGDSSNSVACISNSSSESEEIDVEYIEPELIKPRRRYIRRNIKFQNNRSKKTMITAKQASRTDKSYHNELERKRRQEQRECLDYLRHKLGLPEKASKKLTLNTATEQIEKLGREKALIEDNYKEEVARNKILNSRLLKLMEKH